MNGTTRIDRIHTIAKRAEMGIYQTIFQPSWETNQSGHLLHRSLVPYAL